MVQKREEKMFDTLRRSVTSVGLPFFTLEVEAQKDVDLSYAKRTGGGALQFCARRTVSTTNKVETELVQRGRLR